MSKRPTNKEEAPEIKDTTQFRLGDLDFASRTESSILGGACLSAASLRTIEGSVSESGEG